VCADLQHDAGLLETFVPTPFSLNMSLFYLPLAFAELQYVQQLMRCPRHQRRQKLEGKGGRGWRMRLRSDSHCAHALMLKTGRCCAASTAHVPQPMKQSHTLLPSSMASSPLSR
jgi:hypothetical protein